MNFTLNFRRWTTPVWLYVILVVNVLVVGNFYFSVSTSQERQTVAVKTLGQDATTGIIAAQRVKAGLAEMDAIVGEALLANNPATSAALMQDYATKRQEVTENLLKASEKVVYGPAEETPIKNISYVLPVYHKLVSDAIAANSRGDKAGAINAYREASGLMSGTMLPAADFLDKAYTYALNQRYGGQLSEASSSHTVVLVSGIVLLVLLVGAQVFYMKRFRRVLSIPMAAATAIVAVFFGYVLIQSSSVSANSRAARDDAFDSVHIIWRARAEAVSVRRAELMIALDPARTAEYKKAFETSANRVLRLPEGQTFDRVTGELKSKNISDDLGGYLASEMRSVDFDGEHDAAVSAVQAFGRYINAAKAGGNVTTTTGQAFNSFLTNLDAVRDINQNQFDAKATKAQSALSGLALADLLVSLLVALLIYVGINPRIKEYSV